MRPCASTAAPYGSWKAAPCSSPAGAADAVVATTMSLLLDREPVLPCSGSKKPPGHRSPPDSTDAPLADSASASRYPRSPAASPGCTS